MMETVEDIPKDAILTGLPWSRESYGEHLDTVAELKPAISVAGMVGHCTVRFYVMGERGIEEAATGEDIRRMAAVVDGALKEGAVGFSTSRFLLHFLPDGRPRSRYTCRASRADRDCEDRRPAPRCHAVVINLDAFDSEIDANVREMRAEGLDINGITVPRSGGNAWGLSTGNFFGRDRGRNLDRAARGPVSPIYPPPPGVYLPAKAASSASMSPFSPGPTPRNGTCGQRDTDA